MGGFRISVVWGEITVDGVGKFKDAKVLPDSVREWDWNETGTRHSPGIQPADVEGRAWRAKPGTPA